MLMAMFLLRCFVESRLARQEAMEQAGACRKKRVATLVAGPDGTPQVRLRSETSFDSVDENNTPKRKVSFTPTPPPKRSKTRSPPVGILRSNGSSSETTPPQLDLLSFPFRVEFTA